MRTNETTAEVRLLFETCPQHGDRPACERRMAGEGMFKDYVTLTLHGKRDGIPTLRGWKAALVKYWPNADDPSGDMRQRIDT